MASEKQKRAQAIFESFFGPGPQLFDPDELAVLQNGILALIDQGLTDEQILGLLEEQNPNVTASRQERAEEGVVGAVGDITLPGGGGTAPAGIGAGAEVGGAAPSAVKQRLIDELGISPEDADDILLNEGVGGALDRLAQAGGPAGGAGGRFADPLAQEEQRLINEKLQRELDQNPNLQVVTDQRTGESFLLDTQTGERTSIGQFDFPGIDPERGFQRETGVAQAGINLGLGGEDRLRRQLEQSAEIANQATDISRFQTIQDILRNPSDFIARAFLQRGQESPSGQVTQANLINALREQIRDVAAPQFRLGIEDLFQQGQLNVPGPAAPPAPAPVTPNEAGLVTPGGFTGQVAPGAGLTQEQIDAFFAGVVSPQPSAVTGGGGAGAVQPGAQIPAAQLNPEIAAAMQGFNRGGTTQQSRFLVGDSKGGKLNSNTEMIINPTNAPIAVVPNKDLKNTKGISRFQTGTLVPGSTLPEDPFGGPSGQQLPGLGPNKGNPPETPMGLRVVDDTEPVTGGGRTGPVTQPGLIEDVRRLSPPAVSALFDETQIPDLRFGFNLFTPQQLNRLTDAEQQALNARLGVEFNTTLSDVVQGQRQRFLGQRQGGRGRLIPG